MPKDDGKSLDPIVRIPIWPYGGMHAFCVYQLGKPACGGGAGFGYRMFQIIGEESMQGIGLAVDGRIDFMFGFGGSRDVGQMDSDTTGHASALIEAALGIGVRVGKTEILTAWGIGGDAVGLDSKYDDAVDLSHAEGFYYWVSEVRAPASDFIALSAQYARKLNTFNFFRIYEHRVEAAIRFDTPYRPRLVLWYSDNDGYFITGVGVSGHMIDEKATAKRRKQLGLPAL